jgi:hypothetical protein
MLISNKANPNIRDSRNEGPLHLAAENGNNEMAEILLKSGADVKIKDVKGKTPLMVAARGNYVTIVDMIIKAERCHLLLKDKLTPEVLRKINFKPDASPETQFIRSLLYKLSTKVRHKITSRINLKFIVNFIKRNEKFQTNTSHKNKTCSPRRKSKFLTIITIKNKLLILIMT